MNAGVLERDLFAPRQPAGMRSGLALAILAHVLLVAALAWSVRWKASEPEGVTAELWSALPQSAAPRPAAPEPKPTPVEAKPAPPPATPAPPPKPVQAVRPEPAPPPRADAQIAIERAAREQARREEAERAEAAKQAAQRKREEAQRAEAKRVETERQRVAEQAAEKKQQAEQAKKEEARQAALREANLRRMMKEAGSSDDPAATGNAARSSGPSAGYAGRIKARVKPNIVLTAPVDGNPPATVAVRVAPDGTIVGRKIVKSSGSSVWDETVLRAIDKTEVLPKDVDGTIPPSFEITFRPRD